jgi:hypothetical protein
MLVYVQTRATAAKLPQIYDLSHFGVPNIEYVTHELDAFDGILINSTTYYCINHTWRTG